MRCYRNTITATTISFNVLTVVLNAISTDSIKISSITWFVVLSRYCLLTVCKDGVIVSWSSCSVTYWSKFALTLQFLWISIVFSRSMRRFVMMVVFVMIWTVIRPSQHYLCFLFYILSSFYLPSCSKTAVLNRIRSTTTSIGISCHFAFCLSRLTALPLNDRAKYNSVTLLSSVFVRPSVFFSRESNSDREFKLPPVCSIVWRRAPAGLDPSPTRRASFPPFVLKYSSIP